MELILEAGAYTGKDELKAKLSKEPLLKSGLYYFPPLSESVIDENIHTMSLDQHLWKFLFSQNDSLDQSIALDYEIYDPNLSYGSQPVKGTRGMIFNQKKTYFLRPKEERAEVTFVKINSNLELGTPPPEFGGFFKSLNFKVYARGILSETEHFTNIFLNHWKKYNLLLLNHVFIDKNGSHTYFPESVKSFGVKQYIDEHLKEMWYQLERTLPKSFFQFFRREENRERIDNFFKAASPIKIADY